LSAFRAVRAVSWGDGNHIFATASDPFTTRERGCISIFDFPSADICEKFYIVFIFCDVYLCVVATSLTENTPLHTPKIEIHVDELNKVTSMGWTAGNTHIIAGFDNGLLVKYDPVTGEEVQRVENFHNDRINRIRFSKDKALFVTASKDTTAKLVDPETLDVVRMYKTDRPVNDAVISSHHPHVLIGGGQDAMTVTVTAASQGKFETRFFHMIYEEEFGRVKGHFGPINAIGIHPDGKSYASGAEDGFIRLHHFDAAYMNMPDLIPESLKNSTM
jgi:translation initiation factor 3 subunit I